MSDKLVPANTQLAAKRGFIRTTAQAYAATLPAGGVTAATIAALVTEPDPVLIGATVASALLSPLLAGLASYLTILSSGIPEDYAPALPPRDADTGEREDITDGADNHPQGGGGFWSGQGQ